METNCRNFTWSRLAMKLSGWLILLITSLTVTDICGDFQKGRFTKLNCIDLIQQIYESFYTEYTQSGKTAHNTTCYHLLGNSLFLGCVLHMQLKHCTKQASSQLDCWQNVCFQGRYGQYLEKKFK